MDLPPREEIIAALQDVNLLSALVDIVINGLQERDRRLDELREQLGEP